MLLSQTSPRWPPPQTHRCSMALCKSIRSAGWCGRPAMNILALQYRDSGKLSTDVPNVDTGVDWLVYLAQHSQQCQAQSHFVVRSRLDIVENTEIMAGPNQAFYCGTLRPDYRPFRTGIFRPDGGPDTDGVRHSSPAGPPARAGVHRPPNLRGCRSGLL